MPRARKSVRRLLTLLATVSLLATVVTLFLARGISSALKMEAKLFSETSVHNRSTRRYIPEDSIIRNYLRENLKSYTNHELHQ
jgi:hypothetical protein